MIKLACAPYLEVCNCRQAVDAPSVRIRHGFVVPVPKGIESLVSVVGRDCSRADVGEKATVVVQGLFVVLNHICIIFRLGL